MDYRYLEAFCAAANHLNFTLAAKELNITPAALSRQIKLFERSVGKQLFIRSPQKVSLTTDGQKIHAIAIRFIQESHNLLGKQTKKVIRIGVLHPILTNWLTNFLVRHYKKDRNIDFKITVTSPSQITQMLEDGKLDIGLYNKNIQTDLLTAKRWLREVPTLISKREIDLKDLSKQRWILVEEKDYLVNYAYKKRIPKSEQLTFVNSPTTQVELVSKGFGVAMVSNHMLSHTRALWKKEIKTFGPEYFYIVYPNSEYLDQSIQEFITKTIEDISFKKMTKK